MQDTRQFTDLPLAGTRQPTRIRRDQFEAPSQFLTADVSGTISEYLGTPVVNGTGCTYVKAISPHFLDPRTSGGGGGNFVY